jgi:DNA-binding XRE family transcriptional regulator
VREERGWTQQHAGEKLELSWRHIQDIEAGNVNITLLLLYRYAKTYGFDFRLEISSLTVPTQDPES